MNNTSNEMISPSELAKMIRLGSKDTEKTKMFVWETKEAKYLFSDLDDETLDDIRPNVTKACALGAVLLVLNGGVKKLFTQTNDKLRQEISSLNDSTSLTREEIADWLETL